MNISKHFFNIQQYFKSNGNKYNPKFLKIVLLSIVAPVKISMMPSAPPTTDLPPPAAHQRPKLSFSIDSIVSSSSVGRGGGEGDSKERRTKDNKDVSEEEDEQTDFNSKVLINRSHQQLYSSADTANASLFAKKTLQDVNKMELLNQFRNIHHHPLANFHHHLQQQMHFNQRLGCSDSGSAQGFINPLPIQAQHLKYNFLVSQANSICSNKVISSVESNESSESSVMNNRVAIPSAEIKRSPSISSRSPSPTSDTRKSPMSQSPHPNQRSSSPEESRNTESPANSTNSRGETVREHPGINSMHNMAPGPGQLGPPGPIQPFATFPPLGAPPNFPGLPGAHPHHPGMPPWGHPPNPPHHPVAHPLYPWLLARQARFFSPRFGAGAELPAFLFQPFRKPKRIRTAFSPSQLLRLEHAFEKNHYVVGTERKQLAKSLSLSETQVKVWFQNRRTKHKRTETEDAGPGEKSGHNNTSDLTLCGSNLSSSATSADSSTRHYSEEMSGDEEEIIMDDDYSGDEEEMVHSNYHNK